jgi:uncharacterized protein YkwD
MKRIAPRLVLVAICLALILGTARMPDAGPRRAPSGAGISYLPDVERAVYRLTNQVRQRHGLSPLTGESSLAGVARAHSADMLQRNYFSHQSQDGRSPHERIRAGYPFGLTMSGENIWSGAGYDSGDTQRLARIIVDNWLSSPGHRQNLLNPQFTDIGVGVAGRGRDVRATQVFVRHRR